MCILQYAGDFIGHQMNLKVCIGGPESIIALADKVAAFTSC